MMWFALGFLRQLLVLSLVNDILLYCGDSTWFSKIFKTSWTLKLKYFTFYIGCNSTQALPKTRTPSPPYLLYTGKKGIKHRYKRLMGLQKSMFACNRKGAVWSKAYIHCYYFMQNKNYSKRNIQFLLYSFSTFLGNLFLDL